MCVMKSLLYEVYATEYQHPSKESNVSTTRYWCQLFHITCTYELRTISRLIKLPTTAFDGLSSNTWWEMQSSLIITGINNKGALGGMRGCHGNTPRVRSLQYKYVFVIYGVSWLQL